MLSNRTNLLSVLLENMWFDETDIGSISRRFVNEGRGNHFACTSTASETSSGVFGMITAVLLATHLIAQVINSNNNNDNNNNNSNNNNNNNENINTEMVTVNNNNNNNGRRRRRSLLKRDLYRRRMMGKCMR